MAISITSPQNRVVARAATLLISWSSTYPQTAYEIQWRYANDTAWSTFGRVTSSATSASIPLTNFTDFKEYHYRVILYTNNATSGTSIYDGTQSSQAYSLVITPKERLGIMKSRYGEKMVEVPIYAETNAPDTINVEVRGSRGSISLVSERDISAEPLKFLHPYAGDVHGGNDHPTMPAYSGVSMSTYMRKDVLASYYAYQNTELYSYYIQAYYINGYYATTGNWPYTYYYYRSGMYSYSYSCSYTQSGTYQSYYSYSTCTAYEKYTCYRLGNMGVPSGAYNYACFHSGRGYTCTPHSGSNSHPYSYTVRSTCTGSRDYTYRTSSSSSYRYTYQVPTYNPYYNYYRYYGMSNVLLYRYDRSYHYV